MRSPADEITGEAQTISHRVQPRSRRRGDSRWTKRKGVQVERRREGMSEGGSRVAIVTGAAQGIGRATAWALSDTGATVVIADVDEEGAQRTAAEFLGAGGPAVAQAVDVS